MPGSGRAASVAAWPTGTFASAMPRHGNRHIDRRRSLLPRDYASDPTLFGVDRSVPFAVPAGGDEVSMQVARRQHLLICEWQQVAAAGTQAIARRFNTSKQTISRVRTGQRWIGETLFAALLDHLDRCTPREPVVSAR